MSQIPENIQCFANAEKVCPLRAAKVAVDEIIDDTHAQAAVMQEAWPKRTPGEVITELSADDQRRLDESHALSDRSRQRVQEVGRSLSFGDQTRLNALNGTILGYSTIDPESCETGPQKSFGFFGKPICQATLELHEYGTTAAEQPA